MEPRRSLLVGGFYFLLLTFAFFTFVRWMSRSEGGTLDWSKKEKIALVRIEGMIVDSEGIIEELRQYRDDDRVKAILLFIDSPGGPVVPAQEIHDEVLRTKEVKKVVTSMGNVAASGGYYVASATDWIVANPGTLTGSIGVIIEMVNFQGLLEKVGVEGISIKSGKNKDVGSPFRKMTEEEKGLLQAVIDDVHAQFVEAVSEGRSLDIATTQGLADGRIFTGRQAQKVGLVDALGSLQDAIKITAEMVGIEGEPEVIETEEMVPFFEMMQERLRPLFGLSHLPTFRLSYLPAL